MEKVKVTQEQADAIEEIKRSCSDFAMDGIINTHHKKSFRGNWKCLNKLSVAELARSLYIDYEVELEFKVGDWVKSKFGKGIGKITKIKNNQYHTDFGLIVWKSNITIRHATESEISEEKERRINKKLDNMLSKLTPEEIEQLINKLDYEYEVNGRIADRLDVRNK